MGFVNFHVHSEYSFRSSLLTVEKMARFAAGNGFDGCAVTDLNSTSGFIELSCRCPLSGLKPVFGCEIFVRGTAGKGRYPLIIIALNAAGLLNLYALNTEANRTNSGGRLQALPQSFLFEHSEGLAVLAESEIYSYRNDPELLKKTAGRYSEAFGVNFFLEINYKGEKSIQALRELAELSEKHSLKPVATCEARYLYPDREAYQLIRARRSAPGSAGEFDYSLRGKDEFIKIFKNHPPFIENAEMLFDSIGGGLIAKAFPAPGYVNSHSRLKKICSNRLDEFEGDVKYRERLEFELKAIKEGGISDFFLFSHELACFMKAKGILSGYGKGSNAASLVLFLIQLTKIDPLKHELDFEFYKTPGTAFFTGIEIDIDGRKRNDIFKFITAKFGPRNTALLSHIDRWTARSALSMLARKPGPGEYSETAGKLAGLAKKSEADPSSIAVTAGNIANYAPVYESTGGVIFSGLTREDSSFVNFLRVTLNPNRYVSILRDAQRLAKKRNIDFRDKETFSLIVEGGTEGVYILENYGIREYLKECAADTVQGLCDIIAVYRSGPIGDGTAGNYITRRKNNLSYGRTSPGAHKTNPITWQTYGLILYEEQIIKIAFEAAGMEWKRAFEFMKAVLGNDNPAMLSFKDEFIGGCMEKGGDEESSYRLYGILVDTGRWAVKKTQTLSYAYLAYSLAYMKKHNPAEYLTAGINNNMSSPDIVNRIILDMKIRTGIKILPVDINRSPVKFSMEDGSPRAGLLAVRHLGKDTAKKIVTERGKNGPFKDMLDFALRTASSGLHEKALENLVKAGAFKDCGYGIKELLKAVPQVRRYACRENGGESASLFGSDDIKPELGHFIKTGADCDIDLSEAEKEATDIFISGHPLDRVENELGRFNVCTLDRAAGQGYCAFIVYLFQVKISLRPAGAPSAAAVICDKKGMMKAVFIPAVYKNYSSIIRNHTIYLVKGTVKNGQLIVEQIFLFDEIVRE